MMRWDRAKRAPVPICYTDQYQDFNIMGMAQAMCRPIYLGGLGVWDRRRKVLPARAWLLDNQDLTCIRGEDESVVYSISNGCYGKARKIRCFICRRYHKMPENTVWMCCRCGMPLCKRSCDRENTCLEEHQRSSHHTLGCGYRARTRQQWFMPDELKLYRITRC